NDAFHVIGMVLAVSMLAVLLTRSLPGGRSPPPPPRGGGGGGHLRRTLVDLAEQVRGCIE
ncbi:hypothetical protein, partial [Pseudomonas aeruginosa]